jgi:hypothetical protein
MLKKPKASLICRSAGLMVIVGWLIASFASAQVLNVRVTPTEITGGTGSISVLITLARIKPGATVTLTSSLPAVASVPSSVIVPYGASSFSYTVRTAPVARDTSVRISASVSNVAIPGSDATVRVLAPVLVSFHINPGRVVGGRPAYNPTKPVLWDPVFVNGSVSLSGPAAEDMSITLSSSNPAAIVHSPVFVRASQQTCEFPIGTTNVSAITAAQISVQLGTSTLSGDLIVESCCWASICAVMERVCSLSSCSNARWYCMT